MDKKPKNYSPIVKEFRIPLPITVEEYRRGQLVGTIESSRRETGGGEGVEIQANNPFNNTPLLGGRYTEGQYTKKIYHLRQKFPRWIRWAVPEKASQFVEEAWNAYPYCLTVITNPGMMMGCEMYVSLESVHLPFSGSVEENALHLDPDRLLLRTTQLIDITDNSLLAKEYKAESDPRIVKLTDGKLPLEEKWIEKGKATMCCYKVVSIHFKLAPITNKCIVYAMQQYPILFARFHREMVCSMDKWRDLTMEMIRELEEQLKEELLLLRNEKERKASN